MTMTVHTFVLLTRFHSHFSLYICFRITFFACTPNFPCVFFLFYCWLLLKFNHIIHDHGYKLIFYSEFCMLILFGVRRVCSTTLYSYAFAFIPAIVSTEFPYPICHAICIMYMPCITYHNHSLRDPLKNMVFVVVDCDWNGFTYTVSSLRILQKISNETHLTLARTPCQCKQANPYNIRF